MVPSEIPKGPPISSNYHLNYLHRSLFMTEFENNRIRSKLHIATLTINRAISYMSCQTKR